MEMLTIHIHAWGVPLQSSSSEITKQPYWMIPLLQREMPTIHLFAVAWSLFQMLKSIKPWRSSRLLGRSKADNLYPSRTASSEQVLLFSSRTISGLILPGVDHKWKSGVKMVYVVSGHYIHYNRTQPKPRCLFRYIRQSESRKRELSWGITDNSGPIKLLLIYHFNPVWPWLFTFRPYRQPLINMSCVFLATMSFPDSSIIDSMPWVCAPTNLGRKDKVSHDAARSIQPAFHVRYVVLQMETD